MGFKVLYACSALVFSELHKLELLPLHRFVQSQQFTASFCFHADSLYNAHFSYACAYSKWGIFSIFTELLLALPTIHLRTHNNCCTLLSEMETNNLIPCCAILSYQGHRSLFTPYGIFLSAVTHSPNAILW